MRGVGRLPGLFSEDSLVSSGLPHPQPPIMGVVLLRNLHPDLKLGLVLVSAAALLNVVGLGSFGTEGYAALGFSLNWIIFAGGIGGLAVVPAAIWVDRRPPHKMMAAGAALGALGLFIFVLSSSLALNALGMFVAGVGTAAVGSLVFYAIAAKGATRYKGTLIGALGMVFTMRLGERIFREWSPDAPMLVLGIGVALTLAGAVVLFRLLPRVFAGSYGPGSTFRQTLAVPSVRRAAVWVTVTYSIAYMAKLIMVIWIYNFSSLTTGPLSGVEGVWSQHQAMAITIGISVLLWGIASDFYPVRRLILVAALLLLPTAGAVLAIDGFSTSIAGTVGLGLVRGGLVCLPWVLMAELLPTRHFAKIALGVMLFGSLVGGTLGPILWGGLTDIWGNNAIFWFIPFFGIVLAVVASRLPRPPERAAVSPPRKCAL